MAEENLKLQVRSFWEKETCGTNPSITEDAEHYTKEWFKKIEDYRYFVEPFIFSFAQFTLHYGKKVLEIGVGAGTDHLQWARAGCKLWGVDITNAAIETTRKHLELYGLTSNLQRQDAEELPYEDNFFDIVYSWGVIHHTENPENMVKEIYRVLKPGGLFIGMMYNQHSIVAFKLWIKYALFKGKPMRSFKNVIFHHMESLGTKAYTTKELKLLFREFTTIITIPILTQHDIYLSPKFLTPFFPNFLGWYIAIEAIK